MIDDCKRAWLPRRAFLCLSSGCVTYWIGLSPVVGVRPGHWSPVLAVT